MINCFSIKFSTWCPLSIPKLMLSLMSVTIHEEMTVTSHQGNRKLSNHNFPNVLNVHNVNHHLNLLVCSSPMAIYCYTSLILAAHLLLASAVQHDIMFNPLVLQLHTSASVTCNHHVTQAFIILFLAD